MRPDDTDFAATGATPKSAAGVERPNTPDMPDRPNMNDPSVVLSLLEADQVVATKQQTRFGRQNLSLRVRGVLWGLRIYVVVMLVIVLISVLRAVHSAH